MAYLFLLSLFPTNGNTVDVSVDDRAASLTTSAVDSDCEIVLNSGSWSVNTSDLGTPTAGSDWSAATIDSSTGTPRAKIRCRRILSNTWEPLHWSLKVRRTDGASWRNGTTYYLRKSATVDDNGCSLTGGTDWTEVTTSDTVFFTGCGGYTGFIDFESRIASLSVADDDSGVFTETLTYTVTPATNSLDMKACLTESDSIKGGCK